MLLTFGDVKTFLDSFGALRFLYALGLCVQETSYYLASMASFLALKCTPKNTFLSESWAPKARSAGGPTLGAFLEEKCFSRYTLVTSVFRGENFQEPKVFFERKTLSDPESVFCPRGKNTFGSRKCW